MSDNSDDDLQSSELGTREFWEDTYALEIGNFQDHGDVGEVWFGEDSSLRVTRWLSSCDDVLKDDAIIDLGCGNGMQLIELEVDEKKITKMEIMWWHGIPKSTLFTILKMREEIVNAVQKEGHNVKAKNLKGATHTNLKQAMLEYRLPVDANSQPGPYTEPQLGSSIAPSSAPLTFTQPCDEETWQRLAPDCTYEEYIAADDDITVWGTLDNADIIREQQESSNEEGEEEMEEEPEDIPHNERCSESVDIYSRALKRQGASEELWFQFYNVKDFVEQTDAKKKQTSIMDFFKK
uniref:Uncharacterized protein n=1 Tax=Timema bartmani TaxID=61472 RepID=A0A7R9I3S5_9NEOP|nr:unnamed protein product [Timema bartmani]